MESMTENAADFQRLISSTNVRSRNLEHRCNTTIETRRLIWSKIHQSIFPEGTIGGSKLYILRGGEGGVETE